MNGTYRAALYVTALVALVATFAPKAISSDLSGDNHYILCGKDNACPANIGNGSPAAFRIESLYSNLGGWFQFIELRENSADGVVTPLAGSVITVKHGDLVKRYVIPSDAPAGFSAGGTLLLSNIADWSNDDWGPVPAAPPDYVMPDRLLPTDGGTIDLDGQDPWTFDALPADGSTKLLRTGATAPATGQSFALGSVRVHVEFDSATEYYNAALGHYFVSASEPDIDAIESGRIKNWQATGYSMAVFTVPMPKYCCSMYGQVAVPVCRFYIPPAQGDSHFFSAIAQECTEVAAKFPSFVLESAAAFFVVLPDKDTGACPWPFQPVYRLWNQRADTNHRYIVNDLARRMEMIEQGWLPEGFGPAGVAWCQ
jgi:hypothetical protein